MIPLKDAANRLGISKSKLYVLAKQRRIEHFRIDGKYLFSDEQLQAFLEKSRVTTAKPAERRPALPPPKLRHIKL